MRRSFAQRGYLCGLMRGEMRISAAGPGAQLETLGEMQAQEETARP